MQPAKITRLFALFAVISTSAFVQAGVTTKAINETVEYLSKKFGKEMAETTVEAVTKKVEVLAAKYGDNVVLDATKKLGPQALKYADEAGDLAGDSLRIMSRYGDNAIRVVADPQALKLAAKYGDDATEAIIKHGPDMMAPVLSKYGDDGARAMSKLNKQEAIELATKITDGQLAKLAEPKKILNVIGQYGDNAMVFINKHWKALGVATVCIAFVNNPEPFINGTKELVVGSAEVVTRNVVKPITDSVAGGMNWNIFFGIVAVGILGLIGFKIFLKQRAAAKAAG